MIQDDISFIAHLYCIQEYIHTDIMKNPPTYNGYILNIILFVCIIGAGLGLHYFCKMTESIAVRFIRSL